MRDHKRERDHKEERDHKRERETTRERDHEGERVNIDSGRVLESGSAKNLHDWRSCIQKYLLNLLLLWNTLA
jgi:hypothetical protein